MSSITMGELFARRKLKQETVSGEPRFIPGQYAATKLSPRDAMISYVDREGYVCIMPVDKIGDEWFHKHLLLRVGMMTAEVRSLPRGFGLTDEMQRAITAKKKPADPPQTT